ncbi:hypothetical protein [Nocardia callitridis]|uniref:hypothetical protein n=1 Tax=Nocardia callitridis TaxID=648753 RepID=UPI0031EC4098
MIAAKTWKNPSRVLEPVDNRPSGEPVRPDPVLGGEKTTDAERSHTADRQCTEYRAPVQRHFPVIGHAESSVYGNDNGVSYPVKSVEWWPNLFRPQPYVEMSARVTPEL